VFVSDVPMFTPMMTGIAGRTGSTVPISDHNNVTHRRSNSINGLIV